MKLILYYIFIIFFFKGSEEFIGRALAKPVVKLAEEIYEKPFFPPVLQWFPIYRGEMRAGELLGAFELLQVNFCSFKPFFSFSLPVIHKRLYNNTYIILSCYRL